MKILSLFDGISCGRVALEKAGISVENYYASEVDKYAIQISEKNYPDITHIGNVKYVNGKDYENIDLLMAGFPCQSFSIAGKRGGLEDERGQLVYDLIRILKEAKPKQIILENVASMKKEIQEYLREEFSKATGKEVIINKINASLVSAQNRNRIFFTFKEIPQPEDRGILLKDILLNEVEEKYWFKKPKGNKYRSNQPQSVNRSKANTLLVGGDTPSIILYNQVISKQNIRKLHPIECERLQSLPDSYTEGVSDTQRYKQLGNAFNVEVVKHILNHLCG